MEPLGREDAQRPPCKQGLKGRGFSGKQQEWEHWPKSHLPGKSKPDRAGAEARGTALPPWTKA